MFPCPRTVRFKRLAERVGLTSECQVRGRGSPREPYANKRRRGRSQSGCPINRQGSGIRVLGTPWRSKTQPHRTAGVLNVGASPYQSSEAPGSPALLPEDRPEEVHIESRLALEPVVVFSGPTGVDALPPVCKLGPSARLHDPGTGDRKAFRCLLELQNENCWSSAGQLNTSNQKHLCARRFEAGAMS
jgi:hypothetical protein